MHVCVVHPLGLYRQQLHSIFSCVFSSIRFIFIFLFLG
jgi:hypothetical protein